MNTPFKKRESPLTLNSEPVVEKKVTVNSVPSFQKKVVTSTKVKYTAVMDNELRIRIKVASAKKNIQLSQFIEEAVLEKLEREGF